jgi:peptide-methionine (S)-S-oxide reductase
MPQSSDRIETATLAGGCFWCLEAVYDDLKGVEDVVSGYSGGHVERPSYEQVCTGGTGHAEVVQIKFDSKMISFAEILKVFSPSMTRLRSTVSRHRHAYRSAILSPPEQRRLRIRPCKS